MELKQLVELQNRIHKQNVEVGWWDNPRPYSTFVCLFHSELSEALEGDRKNLKDDHLPQYDMYWVELADFVIRCLDWLGYHNHTEYDFFVYDRTKSKTEFLARMHGQVAASFNLFNDPYYGTRIEPKNAIAYAVFESFDFAELHQVNLLEIIEEKVAYNLHRPDHKKENRDKPEGKKY